MSLTTFIGRPSSTRTPLYLPLDSSGSPSSSPRRQPTLKSKIARLPVLEAPCRQVTLHDCTPGGNFQTPEVHIPAAVFASASSPDSLTPLTLSAPSSPPLFTSPGLRPLKRRRSSMSRQASSDRVASACDSYFHLPAKGSTSPNGVGSRSISGVRLDATQDPALLPPSPLDLPPSSSSLAASRATTQIQVSSRG